MDKLKQGLSLIRDFCKDNSIEDVLYNQKYLEIMAAERHGMIYNPNTQGADATNPITGGDVEIKCCREGGSWQFHWLSKNKMEKLKKTETIILAVHNNYEIVRSYKLDSTKCSQIKTLIEQKSTGTSSIGGHKSFSEKQLKKMNLI